MKLLCPACGAEVQFKSRTSVFAVCSFCSSTLVRQDMNLESLGKMSAMPQDLSPLQIGTSGNFEKARFEIVGRQRISWKSGSWNEWYVFFDDGRDGWLADAQGFYMVSFESREPLELPRRVTLSTQQTISLKGRLYTVDDVKEVTCTASQGELPVKSVQGRKSFSVDLSSDQRHFANIDFAEDINRVFFGKYVEFEDLNLMNLREIDGW